MARAGHGGTSRGGHARTEHPQPRHKVVGELRRPHMGLNAGRSVAPRASAGMATDLAGSNGGHCPTHPAQDLRHCVGLCRAAHRPVCRHREIHHAHAQDARALQAPVHVCRGKRTFWAACTEPRSRRRSSWRALDHVTQASRWASAPTRFCRSRRNPQRSQRSTSCARWSKRASSPRRTAYSRRGSQCAQSWCCRMPPGACSKLQASAARQAPSG